MRKSNFLWITLSMVMVFAMLLGACAPKATETAAPEEPVVEEPVTPAEEPVVEESVAEVVAEPETEPTDELEETANATVEIAPEEE